MPNRDVESIRSKQKFVTLLRRVADAIENAEPVRLQVAQKRFVVPAGARLSVEHEVSRGAEELELQLKWMNEVVPVRGEKKAKKKKLGK